MFLIQLGVGIGLLPKADAPVRDRGRRRDLEVAHRDVGFLLQLPRDDEPQGGYLHAAQGVGRSVGVAPVDSAYTRPPMRSMNMWMRAASTRA